MSYDVQAVRKHFPQLDGGAAHFDGPGGSQVPQPVADAVRDVLISAVANRGSVTTAERAAERIVQDARVAMADLLGADPTGIVFGRSMTQLTYDFARTSAKQWGLGDEVVVTRLDHDANIRPWVQAAEAVGATVRWADFDPGTAELTPDHLAAALSDRTVLVAVTGASNLLGTRPDLPALVGLVHDVGARVYVDGVHLTPHAAVDVAALGADFYACSPYKFLGPHCGVVAGRPEVLAELAPDKLLPSSNAVPERFELGTLPYELLAGTTAAVDFLAALAPRGADRRSHLLASMNALEAYEDDLLATTERRLAELPGATVHSRAKHRTPTLLVSFAGHDSADVYRALADHGVNAPAGSFYALEASRRLGLGDAGALRIGLAPYTDSDDVDRLCAGLGAIIG